jgi:transcriptional regulator with GAF, ATPase, and Fis domain
MKPLPKTDPIPEDKLEQFQRYIFNLSAMFIALPATKVADEIDRRLQEVGEFWDISQVFLSRLTDDDSVLTTIHAYSAPGAIPAPASVQTSDVPWLMETIHKGQPKAMTDVLEDLPEDADADRKQIERLGVKSALILPFIVGGSVQGGLFFNCVRKYREWPPVLVRAMQHLGQILAGALERLKAYDRIEHAMGFDRLLSEISATYINIPSKDMVRFIQKDLGRLGSFLNVERCIFYLAGRKKGTYQIDERFNWWLEEDSEHIKKLQKWLKANPNYIDNYQYCFDKWNRGEVVQFSKLDDLPPEAEKLKQIHTRFGTQSWLSVPISVEGSIVGALVIATTRTHQVWPNALISRIRLFGEIFANAIKRKEHEASLRKAFTEIKRLKRQVEADYVYLRDELTLEHNFEDIIGKSDAIKNVLFKVEQVAPTDASVLILGETGTGKELIARAIHHASTRRGRPLIKVNCAALTPNLIESELFGHEKGAFTGADKQRIGRFELANGASLFLDEIGELPLELQPKLLRVLQEGEFERLGGSRTLRVDARIIAATNRNLEREVERGKFRSDLWYRLNSFPISIPPLRDRLEDIPLFVTHFVKQYNAKIGKRFDKVPRKIIKKLSRYSWPGNIRELDNIISRAVIISEEKNLQISIPESQHQVHTHQRTFKEMESIFILQSLEDSGWKIEGRKGAAQKLDLKPSTLRNKMKRLQICRPEL